MPPRRAPARRSPPSPPRSPGSAGPSTARRGCSARRRRRARGAFPGRPSPPIVGRKLGVCWESAGPGATLSKLPAKSHRRPRQHGHLEPIAPHRGGPQMSRRITKTLAAVAALAAFALGGAALAGATGNKSGDDASGGDGRGRPNETPLTGDTADKVGAAALAKVPGG